MPDEPVHVRGRGLLGVVVVLVTRVWLGFADAEGIGDALVGGGGLTVDAAGVDLEQNGDAVPGAAGYLGGGYPDFTARATPPRAAGRTPLPGSRTTAGPAPRRRQR
jgi:hypothetical protein